MVCDRTGAVFKKQYPVFNIVVGLCEYHYLCVWFGANLFVTCRMEGLLPLSITPVTVGLPGIKRMDVSPDDFSNLDYVIGSVDNTANIKNENSPCHPEI